MANEFTVIVREDSPHLYAVVERLCAKAGMEMPVICKTNPAGLSKFEQFIYDFNAAATHVGDTPHVIIGEGTLRHFVSSSKGVDSGLEGVIAHELGHLYYKDTHSSRSSLDKALSSAPVAGAAVGVLATDTHISQENADVNAKSPDPWGMLRQVVRNAFLGFAAGTAVYYGHNSFIEFRADHFAAKLTKNGTNMVQFYKEIDQLTDEVIKNLSAEDKKKLVQSIKKDHGAYDVFLKLFTHPPQFMRNALLRVYDTLYREKDVVAQASGTLISGAKQYDGLLTHASSIARQ